METAPKKNKGFIVVIVVVVILIGIAGIYLFSKSTAPSKTTTTKAGETSSGLSSLLGNLNLSGLELSIL